MEEKTLNSNESREIELNSSNENLHELDLNEENPQEDTKENTTTKTKTKSKSKPYNLDQNAEATLAYIVPPITGIVVWVLEKENEYIKFHAMQSILFGIVFVIISFLLDILFVMLFSMLNSLLGLLFFVLWLMLMWNAYNGNKFKIPVLGEVAEQQSKKS